MKTFIALVHKDPDSAYGVQFPDVPDCFSAADELSDLVANASEALSLYFEDRSAITPRDMDEIVIDTDVQQELANGAFLIAVPLISLAGQSRKVTITMDAGLIQAVDATAKKRQMTRSGFLASAAAAEIAGRG